MHLYECTCKLKDSGPDDARVIYVASYSCRKALHVLCNYLGCTTVVDGTAIGTGNKSYLHSDVLGSISVTIAVTCEQAVIEGQIVFYSYLGEQREG